jgi:hypothetical protein
VHFLGNRQRAMENLPALLQQKMEIPELAIYQLQRFLPWNLSSHF